MSEDDEKPSNVLSLVKAREERDERDEQRSSGKVATIDETGDALVVGFVEFAGEPFRRVMIDRDTEEELALTPDQADAMALELVRYAAAARVRGKS